MRQLARYAALVLLASLVCGANGAVCPDTTALKQRKAGDTTGNFLSGSMSWTHVSGNTVLIEVVSVWRRKHHWPCNTAVGFSGKDSWPGIGDMLTVVGLSAVQSKQARQEMSGAVSTKLWTGDGKYHELQLKVTSYSIEEDWVMGVSYLQYEYPTPYAKKEPLYEIDGMPLHYVSSPDDKDSTQPFKTVPWMVEFKGCCRWYEGMTDEDVKPDEMLNFNIRATVDLSNHVASPRLVSLPFIYIKPQLSTLLPVCALSAGGKAAMVRKNGGTINYPADDNTAAQFVWSAKGYSASIEGSTDSKDGRCAVLTLGLQPKYLSENRDFVTIEVRMGDAMVTGDYAIYVKGPGLISNQQNARSPFGCMMNSACEGELSLSKRMPIFVGAPPLIDYLAGTPLEIRYIVATNTQQSTLLSTSQGTVQYSLTDVGQDHAGLPKGATMAPVLIQSKGGIYVTSLNVVFTADKENTRPGVDQFISNGQRDYTAHHTAGAAMHLVEGSNFNHGVGGAHISVYMEKAKQLDTDLTDLRHMAAITGVELATPSQVAGFLERGYHKLDKNLLEQSARGEIYIMYKKGIGPPVLDVSSTSMPGYKRISASTSNTQGKIGSVDMYVKYSDEKRVSRSLLWTPCTGQDEEVIICAMASAWNVSSLDPSQAYGTTMQCMLIDVLPTKAPAFFHAGDTQDKVYQAYMGKQLEIALRFKRKDQPLTTVETIPKISFGVKGDINTQPTDPARVLGLLTDRTTTGSRITGADKMGAGLSPVTTASDASAYGESQGFLLWTPSPYQGGWKGQVCIDACLETSDCPAVVGGAKQVCSQTCFSVVVDRCKWALQGEDSFVEIAPRFQTNWLQLWFLNPMVGHPDHARSLSNQVHAATTVNVGRIYKPRWDDTMASVAERFGMSVQRLIDLNADLASVTDDTFIIDGQEKEVCIIPDSCSLAPPSNSGKNA